MEELLLMAGGEEANNEKRVELVEVGKTNASMAILMTKPQSEAETCSITLASIRGDSTGPLANQPALTCAQVLPCGHRFNAMALLTHYATNAMSCPMCRGGIAGARLNLRASFPGEKWVDELEARFPTTKPSSPSSNITWADTPIIFHNYMVGVYNNNVRHSNNNNSNNSLNNNNDEGDEEGIPMIVRIPIRATQNVNMYVVFMMYRRTSSGESEEAPCLSLECPLIPNATSSGTFELSNSSTRQISQMIGDLAIHSISANIFARFGSMLYSGVGDMHVAIMKKTEISEEMTPEIERTDNNNNNGGNNMNSSYFIDLLDDYYYYDHDNVNNNNNGRRYNNDEDVASAMSISMRVDRSTTAVARMSEFRFRMPTSMFINVSGNAGG